ncbi:MAG TPA: co-chaperone GroES family protein [Puia sp.]|jgi:chaperonin GroES|nr:co-chaperone GroES family protein [Puia sp.]
MSIPRPVFDRVIVKPLPMPERSKGGILIPGTVTEIMEDAIVMASASDVIKKGEIVSYPSHLGVVQWYDDEKYKLMNASEIYLVVEEAK